MRMRRSSVPGSMAEGPKEDDMPWYPEMRERLLSAARELSDSSYQRRVWVERQLPIGREDAGFDYCVHFIYDDSPLGEDPAKAIGYFVRDEREAHAISRLVQALDALFDAWGTELSDAQYIEAPEWEGVLQAAKALRQVLESDLGT